MIASMRAELLRLRRWPTLWVLCGAWLALNLTFGYLFTYLSYRSEDGGGFAEQVSGQAEAQALLAQILPDQVSVVAHVAERAEELDQARAEAGMTRAQELMAIAPHEIDFERARLALLRTLQQMQAESRKRV